MSIQAVAWVLEHSEATLANRLVLIAIANHCDARGWNAYPAVTLIAREALVDERTVYRAIDSLEEMGELRIKRRPGKSSIYGIPALMDWQDVRGEGWQDVRGGVTSRPKTPDRMSPKPLRTVTEPAAVTTEPRLPPELPADVKARGKEFFQKLRQGERPA